MSRAKPVKLFNVPQVADMDMSAIIIALDHLAARVEMPDAELERFESIVLRLEVLQKGADETRKDATAEFNVVETRDIEKSSALENVRTYLEEFNAPMDLACTDIQRIAYQQALYTIDDALTVSESYADGA